MAAPNVLVQGEERYPDVLYQEMLEEVKDLAGQIQHRIEAVLEPDSYLVREKPESPES